MLGNIVPHPPLEAIIQLLNKPERNNYTNHLKNTISHNCYFVYKKDMSNKPTNALNIELLEKVS
jgi:hypothetical protein